MSYLGTPHHPCQTWRCKHFSWSSSMMQWPGQIKHTYSSLWLSYYGLASSVCSAPANFVGCGSVMCRCLWWALPPRCLWWRCWTQRFATSQDGPLIEWSRWLLASFVANSSSTIWPSSQPRFGALLAYYLHLLNLVACGFSPASLRAGGATYYFLLGFPIANIKFCGRRTEPTTLHSRGHGHARLAKVATK